FYVSLFLINKPTKEDLKCFNDYETEMKCSLSSERLQNCSGHKLNITHPYTCIFERNHHSDNCECNITVEGFVATEIFNTTLLEGSNVLLYKTFMTSDFIKPKSPVLSVQKIENGNFNVTWDDQINLTYGIKGGHKNTVPNTVRSYEIVAKNLLPNTNYILTATMSTDYNDHSIPSDQSATVEFTTCKYLCNVRQHFMLCKMLCKTCFNHYSFSYLYLVKARFTKQIISC
uniref:Interleukin-4 receptor alpha N-terminal domain-containing protein n=1 Tax=Cyprinus carpio carpio TaxID=630221 RepID=A0A8C1BB96_CYPCA